MSEKRSKKAWPRHQRGASLPLALLLTLICAMAASIVIAASTTAVGRVSSLAASDQAYYSVTSAVNLFRDNLITSDGKGHTVTVAVKANTSSAASSYQVAVQTDGQTETGDYTLLERAAMKLLFGRTYGDVVDSTSAQSVVNAYFANNNWANWPSQSSFFSGEVGTFELEHSSTELSSAQIDALEINVDAALTIDGSLLFSFRKAGAGAGASDLSAFSMLCDANYEFGTAQTSESGNDYEIKYVTVTWTPSTIEKGSTSS